MSEPTQTCKLCGRVEIVWANSRGFPPDAAKRRLKKQCAAAGCKSEPVYRAGVALGGPYTGQAKLARGTGEGE